MKTFQVNITSQHHRNKLRDTVVNWSIEDKIDLFKYLYISMVDFKKCWSLTNLQPLWAVDNLKKSDKII